MAVISCAFSFNRAKHGCDQNREEFHFPVKIAINRKKESRKGTNKSTALCFHVESYSYNA